MTFLKVVFDTTIYPDKDEAVVSVGVLASSPFGGAHEDVANDNEIESATSTCKNRFFFELRIIP